MTIEEAETKKRPVRPPSSVPFLLPLLAMIVATAIIGVVAGEVVVLWGALIGVALAAVLAWVKLLHDWVDAAILVGAATIGLWLVWVAIDDRTGPITMAESLTAAVGWNSTPRC